MLKVIGAGFPRTGTTSTKAALERLGFDACYHMFEVMSHPDHAGKWVELDAKEKRTKEDWDEFLTGYQAGVDWPISHYWRELAEFYPEAKVLHTVRDPRKWYPSISMLMSQQGSQDMPLDKLPEPMRQAMANMETMRPFLTRMGKAYFGDEWRFGEGMIEEEAAIAAFEKHTADVVASVPAERLLVFDVRQGWEPLCDFLGVDVPDEPFPHLNDGEAMKKMRDAMARGEVVEMPTSVHEMATKKN